MKIKELKILGFGCGENFGTKGRLWEEANMESIKSRVKNFLSVINQEDRKSVV